MRPQVRTGLAVRRLGRARVVPKLVPDEQSSAKTSARIASGGLEPDVLKWAFTLNYPVRDAIESHAAGHAQIFHTRFLVNVPDDPHHNVLSDLLDAGSDVHVKLRQLRFASPRRFAEKGIKFWPGHRQSGRIIEVTLIEPERAVVLNVDQIIEDLLHIF